MKIRRIQGASSFAEASADRSICKTSAGIILGSKELGRTPSSALKSFGGYGSGSPKDRRVNFERLRRDKEAMRERARLRLEIS